MEGLVLPVLVFLSTCVVLALLTTRGRGVLHTVQRSWAAMRVRKLLELELPGSHYTILQDVSLPGAKQPVCIDHLVVSAYGIFVIKRVMGNGTISGKPADARWSRTAHRRHQGFPNPLFDCMAQVSALRNLLGVDPSLVNFVVVFTDEVKFSTPMPVNVTRLDGLPLFIEGKDKLLIDFDVLPVLVEHIRASGNHPVQQHSPVRSAIS